MDPDERLAGHIFNGLIGAVLFLLGLTLSFKGWGPGSTLGIPLMIGGAAIPLYRAYKSTLAPQKAEKRPEREQGGSYEIRSSKYKDQLRR